VVTVTEAKNQLSALLDRVQAGETVLIVDRGIPVARLEGAVAAPDEYDGRLKRLERRGLVRRAAAMPPDSIPVDELPRPRRGASAVAALLEERRTGR
jgi:prevent-host-death family protein